MRFSNTLICGTLVKRYKRFLADVALENGTIVTAHCPNTGAMTGCAEPGFKVWLSSNNDPKRKLKYTWEIAVDHDHNLIGINTHNANKLVYEALCQRRLAEFSAFRQYRREVKFGNENSKVDFLLSNSEHAQMYLEVKSVTLAQNGLGLFPDTVTTRGQKHLRELTSMALQGNNAGILFCVQHTGIKRVAIAKKLDPEYFELMRRAIKAGVKVFAFGCDITEKEILLNRQLPFTYDV
ncbi:DNA/RNA nuclease SfsA [Planctobacterium marinum]|uniref:Sugar fermentation stimulation protein homolog n=1 Tax=Planctobacterium marinum TaxID=1631968 RepID=A0AA48KQR9_9ALTE|nr:sugar fermentation stimulation protein [Planctobacterium marinum]